MKTADLISLLVASFGLRALAAVAGAPLENAAADDFPFEPIQPHELASYDAAVDINTFPQDTVHNMIKLNLDNETSEEISGDILCETSVKSPIDLQHIGVTKALKKKERHGQRCGNFNESPNRCTTNVRYLGARVTLCGPVYETSCLDVSDAVNAIWRKCLWKNMYGGGIFYLGGGRKIVFH
ncbi:hypothetical protein EDC01DRAFT_626067 [Geopyxis carbonaria]|nr:hypothetical protein EDC01DRAFT_626067 [Geopyxis carbonaria]